MSRQHLSRVPMAVLGGLAVAAGGAVLGLWVGHATTSQIQTELEDQVDAGIVFVSVTTESPRGPDLLALLAKEGGTQRGRHADHAHRERVTGRRELTNAIGSGIHARFRSSSCRACN